MDPYLFRMPAGKIFATFAILLGAVVLAASQTPGDAAPARPTRGSQSYRRAPTLDEQVKRFAKALDLNESQQAGLKTVLERQRMQARQIQFDESLTGAERIGRFRALQQNTVQQIRALLNDEQKKKYDPQGHQAPPKDSQNYLEDWLKTPQH